MPTATGPRTWSISELASQHDITLRTIRYYEDFGLLSPDRLGQQRIYSERERVRLELILRGRRLGFSLEEIATIVNMYDAEPGEGGQLRYLIEQIERRSSELLRKQRDIVQTLAELAEVRERCEKYLVDLGAGADPGEE